MTQQKKDFLCGSCLYGSFRKYRETDAVVAIWFHCVINEAEINYPWPLTDESKKHQCYWYEKVKRKEP